MPISLVRPLFFYESEALDSCVPVNQIWFENSLITPSQAVHTAVTHDTISATWENGSCELTWAGFLATVQKFELVARYGMARRSHQSSSLCDLPAKTPAFCLGLRANLVAMGASERAMNQSTTPQAVERGKLRRVHRGGGGVHRCQWTPLEVSSFISVSKSTACALTASTCEHVFTIDHGCISSHAHATFIQLSLFQGSDRCKARKTV